MCGIYGHLVELARGEAHAAAIGSALRALGHRGPDGRGSARLSDAHGRVECGLGHTRLAIIDLSESANQPMTQPSFDGGRHVIVFNGEIYNYRELRHELEEAGHHFVTDGDTEVILHLLATHGPGALERVVGMFALAVFDVGTGTLFLARDRLGKKPLYVVHDGRGVAFASEVRALIAAGWAAPRLDAAALTGYLMRGSVREPSALIEGVTELPAGHWMRVGPSGKAELQRYWKVPDPVGDEPPDDWPKTLVETLHDAVRQRLVADVPLGVFLSGGVDSAALVSIASRHVGETLQTFTLTFDEASFDESGRAATTARHFGVRHHEAHLSAHDALHDVEQAFAAQDLPSHDGINTWFIARAARQAGLVVALSGTGGDELFAGYPHFRVFDLLMRAGQASSFLPRFLRKVLSDGVAASLPARARKALGVFGTGGDPAETYAIVREVLSPRQIAQLLPRARPFVARYDAIPLDADPSRILTRLELEGYLRDTQLRDIDAMSMAHGFEVRAPFLDHRLVELLQQIPGRFKQPQNGINKALLVDAAGLPHHLFKAPKRGFVLPWDVWLAGPLRGFAEDLLTNPYPLERAPVLALWHRFLSTPAAVGYSRVLAILALVSWCRRHGVGSASLSEREIA